jgi:DNA repair ATPase RecN
MSWPEPIAKAQTLPGGARFFKCALQVNPYDYLRRYAKSTPYEDEASYNQAIISACKQNDVEVIAVTDHYRVKTSSRLIDSAQTAGLYVFPGFEAVTKDGVHVLCLFDPETLVDRLERVLGDCGIHDQSTASPTGKYDVTELLEESTKWGCVCVAAHVAADGGLLVSLKGQQRIQAWRDSRLLAASLPGSVEDAPEGLRPILENKDPQHRRLRRVALLNATDINSPQDVANPSASCWVKMSSVSIEGLRQAFLDPVSRIRLATDPETEEHTELVAMAWQGGFLDGCTIRFNENLNVLIGGRGAGKSTVIESLRMVLNLDPLGEDARKSHEGIVRHVLKSGTKTYLLVRSHRPSLKDYLIERTIPNPPVVRDQDGSVLDLTPGDVIARVEIYGQREISELTKSREKLTRLLDRFVDRDPSVSGRKAEIRRHLERSRSSIVEVQKEQTQIADRLAALPALEETLKRFQEAGLEERLKEQTLLVREERVLKTAGERLTPVKDALEELRRSALIDHAFLSEKALADLPGREILSQADGILEALQQKVERAVAEIARAIAESEQALARVRASWDERRTVVEEAYETILRELQKSKIDGEEFISLRRQIEELRPLRERESVLQRDQKELQDQRRNLLAEWEDIKAAEFQQLDRAAKRVSRLLANLVRVQVAFGGNREPLLQLLRDQIGGRLSEAIAILKDSPDISLKELADACRSGARTVAEKFNVPPAQAERLAQASLETCMAIEELDLPSTTSIELNVASEGEPAAWRDLDDLSTGQKATAVLLLLLLESDTPLVVDQPEDDLDNRFITDAVVPRMREEKRRRQFLFATHNANVPVLGDAELIVGLEASGEAEEGHAQIRREHMASIDSGPVRELVEELLEGGKEAFETRRLKYGF